MACVPALFDRAPCDEQIMKDRNHWDLQIFGYLKTASNSALQTIIFSLKGRKFQLQLAVSAIITNVKKIVSLRKSQADSDKTAATEFDVSASFSPTGPSVGEWCLKLADSSNLED